MIYYSLQLMATTNASTGLDLQQYVSNLHSLVQHITELTGVKAVTFQGRDLASALSSIDLNQLTQVLENLGASLESQFQVYLTPGSAVLHIKFLNEFYTKQKETHI